MTPFERFVQDTLQSFEDHLRSEGMTTNTITDRMKGAREFARYIVGRPHRKNERTKGTI